ncbi:MFS monocarboxylate transporter, partial [Heterobasidion irregulare TC 32-1]
PVDRGFGAWSFLLAAVIIEAHVWCFPLGFGLFLTAYLDEPALVSQPNSSFLLPLIGTLSTGVLYLTGPFLYPYISRYPQHRRPCMWVGFCLCWTSLLGASYTTKIQILILLQGVLFALGGALLYSPCISYMSEWFVRRRGLANGILFSGSAAGGLFLPFIIPPLIRAHGPFATLRILSVAIIIAVFPALFFIKPRLPEKRVHGPRRRSAGSGIWLSSSPWWILVVANTIQGFGYFVPIIWLPVYTSALNVRPSTASLALSLLNGFAAVGPLVLGTLSDYVSPWLLAVITATLSCISTLVLWGALGNISALMAFGATYGLFAGGWSTLYTGFVRGITEDDHSLSITLYGFLMLTRGLGNVLCTPISTALANISTDFAYPREGRSGFTLEGGRFHKLIVYVGMCYAGAAAVALVGWSREK